MTDSTLQRRYKLIELQIFYALSIILFFVLIPLCAERMPESSLLARIGMVLAILFAIPATITMVVAIVKKEIDDWFVNFAVTSLLYDVLLIIALVIYIALN